jgi:UDP-N-acetylglucosamine:LPS N-acetylglucosamine transferase
MLSIKLLTSTLAALDTEKLTTMSKNAKKLAKPDATEVISNYLYHQ